MDRSMMNFDELILDAAKSIANATSQLIKAAGAAQQELVAQGKVSQRVQMSTEDGQWSKGKRMSTIVGPLETHRDKTSLLPIVSAISPLPRPGHN